MKPEERAQRLADSLEVGALGAEMIADALRAAEKDILEDFAKSVEEDNPTAADAARRYKCSDP